MEIEVTDWFRVESWDRAVLLIIEGKHSDQQITELDLPQARTLLAALQQAIHDAENADV